ncbi:hydroxyethylthiazole kinase [Oceanimonas baumannii]|uniref:Hydroxyethylthiazole kinase n=1 Tax=Oceanimonas baumannii TaxID=129578 RepID=A0A235CH07_9GAMM|nr:hydroxyethylthiazole kinase [Oceanimonas baumannii]MCC4264405.1 hydroxyethylthiazole kinase [Oceanimonas baumannii]OYD23669.1 hydroxyethylthiazole kinase [Oceanimonas baumannii]TDW55865.1 hydroxyethylthiazole kinase [Oceanimonas baumannii]
MNAKQIITALRAVREQKPLVLNITNYVVMNNSANGLLALGASPIMAHSRGELAELMPLVGALVVNIGTLDSSWIERMELAVALANRYDKAVVLDPVGCGASSLRTDTSRRLAEQAGRLIIRANASEIIALAGASSRGKGVDAQDGSEAALAAGRHLVHHYHADVVISGETDIILGESSEIRLENGHSMMPFVTGMGCTLSALTGAFAAVGETSGVAAAAVLGVAGELAAARSPGPGSLQLNLLDTLYQLDADTLEQCLKITVNRQ